MPNLKETMSVQSTVDWSKYKDIKKQFQRECRQAYNAYLSTLVDPNSNTITKKLWSYIKSRKQDHTGIGPLKHQDILFTDTVAKADILADYFSSVFTHEDSSHIPSMSGNTFPSMSPNEFKFT